MFYLIGLDLAIMDQSLTTQNRRQRRSNVLMAAALEVSGGSIPVKLRNLSNVGALVEGDKLPVEGTELVFRRQELGLCAKVVWVGGNRCGLSFKEELAPETVLRHIPTPRPRVLPEFKRPGVSLRFAEDESFSIADWAYRPTYDRPGE